jgi:hypothetical protein
MVKGFGRRPHARVRLGRGPAFESLPWTKPRAGRGSDCLDVAYGDLMVSGALLPASVSLADAGVAGSNAEPRLVRAWDVEVWREGGAEKGPAGRGETDAARSGARSKPMAVGIGAEGAAWVMRCRS